MILPTGRLNGARAPQNRATMKHTTFTVPFHSDFNGRRSQDYHKRLNPNKSEDNAVRYPQTGLGG